MNAHTSFPVLRIFPGAPFSSFVYLSETQRFGGLIAAPDSLEITTEDGIVAWSQDAYAFLNDDAPDSANPSLWRNTQLNLNYS
jgi:alkyl sulfatase BDS1-like metallo-beta-lactamase superfamily hydrolase